MLVPTTITLDRPLFSQQNGAFVSYQLGPNHGRIKSVFHFPNENGMPQRTVCYGHWHVDGDRLKLEWDDIVKSKSGIVPEKWAYRFLHIKCSKLGLDPQGFVREKDGIYKWKLALSRCIKMLNGPCWAATVADGINPFYRPTPCKSSQSTNS